MKLPIRTQPDTVARLKAQRDALTKRLQDAEQKLERIDALDAAELIALEDDLSTTKRAVALVAERLDAAEQEARQVATAEEEAQRLAELATERKAYDAALAAVVGDTIRLEASLQGLGAVRLRLGALGDFGAADATLHLAQAVARTLLIWRLTAPEMLGLPAYNREEENRVAALHDAAERLARAERRLTALRESVKEGFMLPAVVFDAAKADVRSAKRELALASGQPWTAQDEAQAGQAEPLIFTGRSIAEIEESLLRQTRARDVAPPPTYAPTRRR